MSFCVAQGTPLNYMTTWMGGVFWGPEYMDTYVESVYSPSETQNIVNQLYSNTIKIFDKVWIVGM